MFQLETREDVFQRFVPVKKDVFQLERMCSMNLEKKDINGKKRKIFSRRAWMCSREMRHEDLFQNKKAQGEILEVFRQSDN